MNDNALKNKKGFPFITVLVTVLATLVVAGSAAYLAGYFGPTGKQPDEKGTVIFHEEHAEETLYSCGMHPWIIAKEPGNCPICGMELTPKRNGFVETEDTGEREIAYWRAPMNPTEIYDKPGKSAMGMDLVPVYEDEVPGGVEIKIDPVTQQNMGIRTAAVKKGALVHTIRTYGHITYDETRTAQINPRFSGWLEKLYINFTGQFVKKGEPMYEIYSPELITAQEEYLEAYRSHRQNPGRIGKKLLESVRRRLEYFDIADKDIRNLERSNRIKRTMTVRSPYKGVVTHKNVVEGGFVKAGTTIYKIADLSRVWVEAHIYEYELSQVVPGLEAHMTLPYRPGKVFTGKVAYVYPYLQQKTRDVVIRLEFENPDLELKPDMYADVSIKTAAEDEGTIIPSESVIRSGKRNVVFVDRGKGKFTPREITLGVSLDEGMVQVLAGIAPGEVVVTSGQFLLDSESKLKEAVQKMLEVKSVSGESRESKDDVESDDDFFGDME